MFTELIISAALIAGIVLTPIIAGSIEDMREEKARLAAELQRRGEHERYVRDFFRQIAG